MRGLTLAEALRARGASCSFVVTTTGARLVERFGRGSFSIHRDPLRQVLASEPFDALVLDDYEVSADAERGLRQAVPSLIVIDDLANREHLAGLLIDPGYGRTPSDYDGLLPAHAPRLIGPAYALVRQSFTEHRPTALSREPVGIPRRAFMSFGLSDVGGIAARAAALVRNRHPDLEIDLALASDAASASALKARAATDPKLHLHFDAANMADLMARADIAIGAGGASTWERACLGLPTLAVIVAENQRSTIERMATDGALLAADLAHSGFEAAFIAALTKLWPQDLRAGLRARSAALCDGLGAERIAQAILAA